MANTFQSRFGSDIFSTTAPSSDLIISCSNSYYEAETKYIIEQNHLVIGSKRLKLTPEQYRKEMLERELDEIQASFQH
jgi:hypothetical protein